MNESEFTDRGLKLMRERHAYIELQVEEAQYRCNELNEIVHLADQMIMGEATPDLTLIRNRLKGLGW